MIRKRTVTPRGEAQNSTEDSVLFFNQGLCHVATPVSPLASRCSRWGCMASESLAGARDGPHRVCSSPVLPPSPRGQLVLASPSRDSVSLARPGTDFSMKQFAEGSTLKLSSVESESLVFAVASTSKLAFRKALGGGESPHTTLLSPRQPSWCLVRYFLF